MDLFGSFILAVFTLSFLHCNVEPVRGFGSYNGDVPKTRHSEDAERVTSHMTSEKINFVDNTEIPGRGCIVSSSDELILKTSSRNCIVKKGEPFRFLCERKSPEGSAIYYCNILPPTGESLSLHTDLTNVNESYRYYGKGLEKGHCGIEIYNIEDYHNGKFKCMLGIMKQVKAIVGSVDIIVPIAPKEDPQILISPKPELHSSFYRENTTIVVTCEVGNSRPAADISWFINGQNVTDRAGKIENITSKGSLVTVRQNLTRILTWEDNNMTLACRADHLELPNPLTQHKLIYVYFSPRLHRKWEFIEKSIKVQIKANPKPTCSWTVGNDTIFEGYSKRKFMVEPTVTLGNSTWLTVLKLPINASELDNSIKFILHVRNDVGNNSYEIMKGRTASEGTDTKEDDGTYIVVSIVLVGLVIAFVFGIAYYAHITRLWCFSGTNSTPKEKIGINDKEKLQSGNNSENIYSYFVEKDSVAVYQNNLMEQKELVREPPMTNGQFVPPVRQEPEGKEIVYAELEIQKVQPAPQVVLKHDAEGTQYAEIVHKDQSNAK